MSQNIHPYIRNENNGKKIAVIGSGPAGLACSHRLSMLGYDVEIFESKSKAGGLNEYGIATYKSVDNFAAKEVDWLLKIGGIKINHNKTLGVDFSIDELRKSYDAIFIGCGFKILTKFQSEVILINLLRMQLILLLIYDKLTIFHHYQLEEM